MVVFLTLMATQTFAKVHRLIIQSFGVIIQENIFTMFPRKVVGVKFIQVLAIALSWVTCTQAELEG